MDNFKFAFFLIILLLLVLINVFSVGSTEVTGLSLKNAVLYIGLLIILVEQISTKSMVISRVPGVLFLLSLFTYSLLTILLTSIYPGELVIYKGMALGSLKNSLFDPIFLYIIPFVLFTKQKYAKKGLIVCIICFGMLNILAIISFYFNLDIIKATSHAGTRFSSFSDVANQAAYMLLFMIPLLFYFYKYSDSHILKFLFLTFIITSLVGILITGSRGGILILFMIIIFLPLISKNYNLFILSVTGVGISIVVALIFYPEIFYQSVGRFDEFFEAQDLDEFTSRRASTWLLLYEFQKMHPVSFLSGFGWGSGIAFFWKYNLQIGTIHNFMMTIFFQTGLIGLLIFIAFFASYLSKIYSFWNEFAKYYIFSMIVILWNLFGANLESSAWYFAFFGAICTTYLVNKSAFSNNAK
jgi:hypothetical protein